MAILARRRRGFDERLPDGRSVYEAVHGLSREVPLGGDSIGAMNRVVPVGDLPREVPGRQPVPLETTAVDPSANTLLMRHPIVPVPGGRLVAPAEELPAPDPEPQRDFTPQQRTLADMPAPPAMIQHNNKGRPVAIIGGDDPIHNNLELIRAQEGYKAPRSTKDQLLALLGGGVGGAIDYATNQKTRNRWAVGEDIANEEGQIGRDLGLRKSQNDLNRAGLQEDLIRSQIGENKAQAQRAAREPLTREPGFTLGEGQERYDAQGNVIASRPGKPTSEKPPERNVINGVLVERQADGTWKPVYESPTKPDVGVEDADAKYKKAEGYWDDALRLEKEASQIVTKDALGYDDPSAIARQRTLLDEAANLKSRTRTLQEQGDALKIKAKSGVRRGGPAPSPSTHILSKKDWLRSHPESDWPKAVAAAKAGGYQIVE
jgi:hypothetical protein